MDPDHPAHHQRLEKVAFQLVLQDEDGHQHQRSDPALGAERDPLVDAAADAGDIAAGVNDTHVVPDHEVAVGPPVLVHVLGRVQRVEDLADEALALLGVESDDRVRRHLRRVQEAAAGGMRLHDRVGRVGSGFMATAQNLGTFAEAAPVAYAADAAPAPTSNCRRLRTRPA